MYIKHHRYIEMSNWRPREDDFTSHVKAIERIPPHDIVYNKLIDVIFDLF
jgi:hypothetical protein